MGFFFEKGPTHSNLHFPLPKLLSCEHVLTLVWKEIEVLHEICCNYQSFSSGRKLVSCTVKEPRSFVLILDPMLPAVWVDPHISPGFLRNP